MTPPAIQDPEPPPAPSRWEPLRQKLLENWTGILGSGILVLGVSFFAILGSLYLGPEGRFLIVTAVALLLFGARCWLQRYPQWSDFGTWLQAASGAILLVACVGAGGIPGLQFLTDPLASLALLLIGIAINLAFGYFASHEAVACLHVAFSLASLAVAPATPTILLVGALVTGVGIFFSYREKWDLNLIVCLLVYSTFHFYWLQRHYIGASEGNPLDAIRWYGIGANLFVGILAALVHYRKNYETGKFEPLPAVAHLLNWGALGANLFAYALGSPITAGLLLTTAVVTSLLARLAKRRGIRWLYVMDTIIGQLLFFQAVQALARFQIPRADLSALAFLEALVFSLVLQAEKDYKLLRALYAFAWGSLAVFLFCAATAQATPPAMTALALASRCAILAAFIVGYQWLIRRWQGIEDSVELVLAGDIPEPGTHFSPLAFFVPVLFGWAAFFLRSESYAFPGLCGVYIVLAVIRSRSLSLGLGGGLLIVTLMLHVHLWHSLTSIARLTSSESFDALTAKQWGDILAVIVLDLAFFWRRLGHFTLLKENGYRFFVYLLGIHLLWLSYRSTQSISDFAPGLLYLLGSLLALELARIVRRAYPTDSPDEKRIVPEYLLHIGYLALGLFLFRHLVVHLQSELTLGGLSLRLCIEGFALICLIYWMLFPVQGTQSFVSSVNRFISPLFLEWALGFLTFALAYETDPEWHPIVWALMALGLWAGSVRRLFPGRLVVYAWLYFIASAIQLGTISSSVASPLLEWYHDTAVLGVIALLLQAGYVAAVFLQRGQEIAMEFPRGTRLIRAIARHLQRRPIPLIFYPLAFSIALFIYWRFDHAVLTLLWVLEIFGLFVLGIYVREKHFVRFSLAALSLCILRLLLYDLSETQILVRASVFVAIGLIMLAINAIYRKYKGRFQ